MAERGVDRPLAEVTRRFEEIYQGSEAEPGLRRTERLLLRARRAARPRPALPAGRGDRPPRASTPIASSPSAASPTASGPWSPWRTHRSSRTRRRCASPSNALGVATAWMVGDTPDDLRAARGAAVLPIGVIAPGDDPEPTAASLQRAGAAIVLPETERSWRSCRDHDTPYRPRRTHDQGNQHHVPPEAGRLGRGRGRHRHRLPRPPARRPRLPRRLGPRSAVLRRPRHRRPPHRGGLRPGPRPRPSTPPSATAPGHRPLRQRLRPSRRGPGADRGRSLGPPLAAGGPRSPSARCWATLACENVGHVLRSLAMAARCALHVDVLRGDNDHHRAEAAFKATALALRQATAPAAGGIRSTKGTLGGGS